LKDEIILKSDLSRSEEIIAKCAISHGLALCVKLSVYEENIERTIQGTKHLPEELAADGGIKMSSHDISRILNPNRTVTLIHHMHKRLIPLE